MHLGLFALVSFAALSHAPARDDYPKNPNIDVLNYVFRLVLRDDTNAIEGAATVDIRFRTAGVTHVRLDLVGPSTGETGMSVREVTVAGRPVPYTHADDVLLVTLPAPSTAAGRVQVVVAYDGAAATGLIIGPNKHGDRTFFSDNWPNKTRHWLPTVDHPYDKAMCEFVVDAPAHYQIISNGLLIEETDLPEGRRRTHWRQSVPIATWLFALGAAPFAVQYVDTYQGKSIQTWVYAQDRDAGFYDFAVPTKDALEFYGDRVGPFSYEKLANVQSNSVGGGMEAATAIFYGDNSVTGTRSVRWRNVIIHEVAHQWFGNAVTEYDWDDVWLSEGFATYFTLLFIEHAYGRDEFLQGVRSSRDRVFRFYDENPDYRIVHDNLTDMRQVTTSQTYQKGGWVLHMLRGLIGDDAFWRGIRAYYRAHQDANASTDDFRRAMEEASGRNLEEFFHQWLYDGGALIVDGDWQYDPARGVIAVRLDQIQDDGHLFRMPVTLAVYVDDATDPVTHQLDVSARTNRFTVPTDSRPVRVVLDPETWVLMRAQFGERR